MAYATLDQVERHLGWSNPAAADQMLLATKIAAAQDIITRRAGGRLFEALADSTRYFDSVRDVVGRVLYLDTDLCAITSITNGDGTVITSGQYITEPRNTTPYYAIRLLGSANITWEPQADGDTENAITIVGLWAFSQYAPADITEACIEIASYLYRSKDDTGDLSRPVIAGNATFLPGSLSAMVDRILAPYKRAF